jgi:Family of unknown function (DUF6148)
MALTLDEAKQLRAAYLAAQLAIASGKSYTIGTRTLTRADEQYIGRKLAEYDQLVDSLSCGRTGGVRVIRVMPRDL